MRVANLTSAEAGCRVGAVSVALPETVLTPRRRNMLRYPIGELPKMAIFPLQGPYPYMTSTQKGRESRKLDEQKLVLTLN